MLRVSTFYLFAGLTLAAILPQAQAQSAPPLKPADAYAIKNGIDQWLTSCSARKIDECMAMYADDVVGAFQGAAADYDFDALKTGHALFNKAGVEDAWANDVEEINGSGDMAFVRSNRTLTRTPKGGGTAATLKLRAIEILRRGEDGTWKIARFVMYLN